MFRSIASIASTVQTTNGGRGDTAGSHTSVVRVVFVVVVFVVVVVVVVVFVVFALFIDLLTDQVQPLSRCVVRRPRVEGAGQNSTPPRTAWGGAPPGTTNCCIVF